MELALKITGVCYFELEARALNSMYGRAFGFEFATEPSRDKPADGKLWEIERLGTATHQLFLKYGGISLIWNRADVF